MRKFVFAATAALAMASAMPAHADNANPMASYLLQRVTVAPNGMDSVEIMDSGLTATDCGNLLAAMPEPMLMPNGNILGMECAMDLGAAIKGD